MNFPSSIQNGEALLKRDYPNRIVIFIDVLGFSRDVLAVNEHPGLFVGIDALLHRIANCKSDVDKNRARDGAGNCDVRMTHFSDCMVMSILPRRGSILRALANSAFLAQTMLRGGYLPRGAIALGPLVHNDNIVFGRGLVEAHRLEQSVAKTPRILISDDAMRLVEAEIPKADLHRFVLDRGEGPFVHMLGASWPFVTRAEQDIPGGFQEMFEELRDSLPIRFSNAPDDRAKEKILWMREYINETVDILGLSATLKIKPLE